MNTESNTETRFDAVPVDLRNPGFAALLAWLWPGAGHVYQRRYGKAILFMVCILVTYFWGLAMGDGHVVYASFRKQDMRYEYLLQMHVGLPAMPALAQNLLSRDGEPFLGTTIMAPPRMDPTQNHEQTHDEKAEWHSKLGFFFELGTLFTMIAGLLNLLAVFDAYCGPSFTLPEGMKSNSDGGASSGETVGGTIETVAMILGVIAAMTLKYRLESGSGWVSYVYAIGGGCAGLYLARGLNFVFARLLNSKNTRPVVDENPTVAVSDSGRESEPNDD